MIYVTAAWLAVTVACVLRVRHNRRVYRHRRATARMSAWVRNDGQWF